MAAAQSQAPRAAVPAAEQAVQLALDLGDAPDETRPTGLPEMSGAERVKAELEVLGLDASAHVLEFYEPLLQALGITRSQDILAQRSRAELLVAGVKVATQTPPVRSGRRVVFLTLDDATGPVDATFFEDVQGPYAATVFHSWLLLVRGILRRTGPRGVSLRATGAWELSALWEAWCDGGLTAVHAVLDDAEARADAGPRSTGSTRRTPTRRSPVPRPAGPPGRSWPVRRPGPDEDGPAAGGMGGGERHRRVLVHASGFKQSPYADVKPPGEDVKDGRKLASAHRASRRARTSCVTPRPRASSGTPAPAAPVTDPRPRSPARGSRPMRVQSRAATRPVDGPRWQGGPMSPRRATGTSRCCAASTSARPSSWRWPT